MKLLLTCFLFRLPAGAGIRLRTGEAAGLRAAVPGQALMLAWGFPVYSEQDGMGLAGLGQTCCGARTLVAHDGVGSIVAEEKNQGRTKGDRPEGKI